MNDRSDIRHEPSLLFGREREIVELRSGVEAAIAGHGSVWLVTGEPGIGKSRLLEETAAVARAQNLAVHWGRSWEAGGAPAYWPWIQVLRSILASGDSADLVPAWIASHLVQILPELDPRLPDGGPSVRLEPEQARFALMDAVAGVLRESASASPLVIFLEDLHAADPASITLLDFVGRQLRSMPLLLVCDFRETETRQDGVGDGLAAIARGARVLRLGRLGADEVADCIRAVTGAEPGPRVVSAIHEATEGNPLFVVEIADLMGSRGQLEDTGDRIDITIPDSVKAVIRERADALDPRTRELLEAASIIGREFKASDLADLVGLRPEEVEGPLADATTARIVDRVNSDTCRFVHILIREVFHSAMSGERRRTLHRDRADLLLKLEVSGRMPPWSELAHHLLEAGPDADERAFEACLRAAEHAMTQLAFADAAELLARALAVGDRVAAMDPAARCELLLHRAEALLRSGDISNGREICREAAATARHLGHAELLAKSVLIYGSVFVYSDIDRTLVDLLREALAMLETGDSALRARLQARLAAAMTPAEDPEPAMGLAREAISMARRLDDRHALLHAIRSGCSALMDLADPAERLALNREHVGLAMELGEEFEALRGYMRIAIDALDLGDHRACDTAIDAYEDIAAQTRLPHHLWPVASFRAMRAMMEGRFEDAGRLMVEASRHSNRLEDLNAERTVVFQRFGLARTMEDFDGMQSLTETQMPGLRPSGFTELFLRLLEGSNLARMNRLAEAPEGMISSLIEEIVVDRGPDRSILCPAAEVAAAAEHRTACDALYRRLEPYSRHWVSWGLFGMVCEGPISRHLALLASSLDREDEAERHFRHALETTRRSGLRPIAARVGYEYARHLADLGDSAVGDRIANLVCQVETTAEDLGQRGLLELVAALRGDGGAADPVGTDQTLALVPSVALFSLQREGEIWVGSCGDERFNLKNTKGVRMLARLVGEPGREVHVLELAGSAPGDQAVDGGDAGEILDATAKAQYQRRVEELRLEIEEAENWNDPERATRAREELETIAAELSRAFGLGGRERRAGSAAERARVNVQRRLRDAVKRVAEQCPAAGKHLDWALKTGMYCVYDPS